jgi:hypothetical protein
VTLLALASPLETAQGAQDMLRKDLATAVIVGLTMALLGVVAWVQRLHRRLADTQDAHLEQVRDMAEKHGRELERVRKEHMATLIESQHAQRAMLQLHEELRLELMRKTPRRTRTGEYPAVPAVEKKP